MVSLASLWLPIVVGAVFVFIVSSLVHMVFRWHQADYRGLPNEDEVRAAVRKTGPAAGQYVIPYCAEMKQAQTPEMQQKYAEGPVAMIWLWPSVSPPMGKMLGQWFALALAVSFLTAYIAGITLAPGTPALTVLRVTATIGFLAYATGSVSDGIWFGKPWSAVAKDLLDALLFAFANAAAFAWLWPAA